MKFPISLILLSTSIVILFKLNEAQYIGALIKSVHDKYKTVDRVNIVSGTNNPSFEKLTMWHEAVRMLSNEGISTRMLNFRQFEDKLKVQKKRTTRSLTVINVDTTEEMHTFESITKDLYMSYALWLIYFARDASRDVCEFCRSPHGSLANPKFGSKVLISCCDSNMIEEWWHMEENRTQRQELGRLMDENLRIMWFSDELVYGRRYTKESRVLRIAVNKQMPALWPRDDGGYDGPMAEGLHLIQQALNFTAIEILWEDGLGGWNPKTSNWTGLMGRIHRREADMGCCGYAIDRERYDHFSFTAPVAMSKYQLHFKKYDDIAGLMWNAHFKTLTMDVWIVTIGLILTTPILLTIIRYKRRSHLFSLLFEHQLHVWGIYCHQGLPEFPAERPSRMIYLSILLSALVTLSAYSATIISSLTTPSHPPFSTMEEFVRDGTYKLIMVSTLPSSELYKFKDQTLMNKLMSLVKPKDALPPNYDKGFEQVCRERVALYASEAVIAIIHKAIPCEITSINTGRITNIASIIMPRGSEYLDLVNNHVQRCRTSGILERMVKHTRRRQLSDVSVDLSPVNLQGIAPVLIILALGFVIALIIFMIERNFYPSTKNSEILIRLRNQKRRKILRKNAKPFPFAM